MKSEYIDKVLLVMQPIKATSLAEWHNEARFSADVYQAENGEGIGMFQLGHHQKFRDSVLSAFFILRHLDDHHSARTFDRPLIRYSETSSTQRIRDLDINVLILEDRESGAGGSHRLFNLPQLDRFVTMPAINSNSNANSSHDDTGNDDNDDHGIILLSAWALDLGLKRNGRTAVLGLVEAIARSEDFFTIGRLELGFHISIIGQ
mmetsp:Transcript_455/g.672  ORF Transcript_455/g.672 Transcript_455/m.672 type:complete len:205 (-) Transcript_455:1521-2135(-)